LKIYLYYIGKARDTHANAMAAEYIKRSGRFATCEMREIQPKRFDPWDKHPSARKFCRSGWSHHGLGETHTRAGSAFVIGGRMACANGEKGDVLPAVAQPCRTSWLGNAGQQIYRALTTLRGHP
jgi:23S rRNA (pseudouridine1915-N3)-methyltransferase